MMDRSPALDLAMRRDRGRRAAPAIRRELAETLGCAPEEVAFASLEDSDRLLTEIRRVVLRERLAPCGDRVVLVAPPRMTPWGQ